MSIGKIICYINHSMTEIVLKPELIKNLQKVLVDYDPANQDPILAAQYLSAVVGSIVASSSMPGDQKKEILNQIQEFISYVYDQQTQTTQQPEHKSDDAYGVWKPK